MRSKVFQVMPKVAQAGVASVPPGIRGRHHLRETACLEANPKDLGR